MENLTFILWMVLYPISTSISSYLKEKTRKEKGEGKYKESTYVICSLIYLFVYVFIARKLYVG